MSESIVRKDIHHRFDWDKNLFNDSANTPSLERSKCDKFNLQNILIHFRSSLASIKSDKRAAKVIETLIEFDDEPSSKIGNREKKSI